MFSWDCESLILPVSDITLKTSLDDVQIAANSEVSKDTHVMNL